MSTHSYKVYKLVPARSIVVDSGDRQTAEGDEEGPVKLTFEIDREVFSKNDEFLIQVKTKKDKKEDVEEIPEADFEVG